MSALMLYKYITFYWRVTLLIGKFCDDRLKQIIKLMSGKYKDKGFAVDSMEQMSNIFARACDIIIFSKEILMEVIDTSEIKK